MFRFPLTQKPKTSREPFSAETLAKTSRLRGATVTESVCPYCAVGCGQLIYTKGGKLIDIEGNPESPINEGTLCPKGANAFQLAVNPHRVTQSSTAPPTPTTGRRSRWTGRWTRSPSASRTPATPTSRLATNRAGCSTRCAASARSAGPRSTTRRTTSSRSCSAAGWEWCRSRTRRGYDTAPRCPVWAPRSAAARPPPISRTWPTAIASCSWARTWPRPTPSASAGR